MERPLVSTVTVPVGELPLHTAGFPWNERSIPERYDGTTSSRGPGVQAKHDHAHANTPTAKGRKGKHMMPSDAPKVKGCKDKHGQRQGSAVTMAGSDGKATGHQLSTAHGHAQHGWGVLRLSDIVTFFVGKEPQQPACAKNNARDARTEQGSISAAAKKEKAGPLCHG